MPSSPKWELSYAENPPKDQKPTPPTRTTTKINNNKKIKGCCLLWIGVKDI